MPTSGRPGGAQEMPRRTSGVGLIGSFLANSAKAWRFKAAAVNFAD